MQWNKLFNTDLDFIRPFIYVREKLNGELTCVNTCKGEDKKIVYKITIRYKSIYNPQEKQMSIQRSVLLGYTL